MTFPSTKTTLRVLACTVLFASIALGQRPERGNNSLRVQYLVFERPGPVEDTSAVDFLYRLPGSQFVFLRDQATGTFIARGELYVEFRNEDGSRILRDFAPLEIRRQQQVQDQDDIDDYQGVIRFRIPSGDYRAIVEVKDLETGRSFLDRSRRYTFGLGKQSFGLLSNALLVYRDTTTGSFVPFNRGRSVRFGSRGGLLLSARDSVMDDSVSISWQLTHTDVEGDMKLTPINTIERVPRGGTIVPLDTSERLSYALRKAAATEWTSYFLSLPFERLEPGMYDLSISMGAGSSSPVRSIELPVVWENKPASLNRFDLAVDALRYIASEEDIDDMVGFLADGGRERFREFWLRKDPDTSSAYNEVMMEYYRRVDETILRFSTQGELDGYRSDRGRIYILFGAPTTRNRLFRPETGPREIWEYSSQRKRFIFTDPTRTGDYTLSQTEDL